MNSRLLTACAAAALAFGIAGGAHAGVIFVDSFETPMTSGISYGGTDDVGAQFGSGTGLQQNGSPFGYAAAPDGTQTAHIQGDGSFTETVTGLTDGATYTLSFYDAQRGGYGVDPIVVSYEPLLGSDPSVITDTPASTSFSLVSQTFTYHGASPTAIFTIAGMNPQTVGASGSPSGDFNAAVDVFQISAVPEPSVWIMMLGGVAMMGAALRFGRKRNGLALAA